MLEAIKGEGFNYSTPTQNSLKAIYIPVQVCGWRVEGNLDEVFAIGFMPTRRQNVKFLDL